MECQRFAVGHDLCVCHTATTQKEVILKSGLSTLSVTVSNTDWIRTRNFSLRMRVCVHFLLFPLVSRTVGVLGGKGESRDFRFSHELSLKEAV